MKTFDFEKFQKNKEEFKKSLVIVTKDKILSDPEFGYDVWGALSNVSWKNDKGEEIYYTFREAGRTIAEIIDKGDYLDWYCSGNAGMVPEWLIDGMKIFGWTPMPVAEEDKINFKDFLC